MAEAADLPQPVAEVARFVGGGVGAETANAAKMVLQKYALVPALGLASKFKHEAAKKLLEKLQTSTGTLASQERELLDSLVGEIRGGPKSDTALQNVGSIMGAEGQRLMSASELQMAKALRQSGSVGNAGGYPGREKTLADVGGELQSTILSRNKAALDARSAQYAANEKLRDSIVAQREGSGQSISATPEYLSIVDDLKAQTQAGKRSADVAGGFATILRNITA
jgi:hypothetical protein